MLGSIPAAPLAAVAHNCHNLPAAAVCINRPLLPICLLQPERLSAEKFEMMLWRLEVTNAGEQVVAIYYCAHIALLHMLIVILR